MSKKTQLAELLASMKALTGYDTEADHIRADDLLCAALEILGQKELVEAYDNVPKWYA